MKKQRKQKGITLVALVITIIILLILAGITIGTLNGENGLIAKVNQAKKAQIEAEMKEELTLAINELQLEKEGKATLDDITQEWLNENITNSECSIVEEDETKGKTVSMQKNGHTAVFLIDLSLNVTEKDITISTIEFSYEQTEKNGEDVKILIKVIDKINGLNKVVPTDGDEIIIGGSKEEKGIDTNVKVGVEYKYKIISMSGEEKEETIFIEPTLTTTNPIINTTTNATSSAGANSIEKGTTLYINFSATMDITGGTITIKNKDDGNPLPYAVTTNKKYIFVVTGTYGENKTITKEVEVLVNQYKGAQGVVAYDAGEWTREEIEELNNKQLYVLNSAKTTNNIFRLQNPENDNALNFTFGGFTYKGDTEHQELIDNGTIITSRNQSVSSFLANVEYTPKYDGWQILESREENGKTYITKIMHTGSPENFVLDYTANGNNFRAEYLLSSGLRLSNYSTLSSGETINPRSWQMYIDEKQKDLIADTTDKDGNILKDIHAMTYDEARTTKNVDTGSNYYLATHGYSVYGLWYWCDYAGFVNNGYGFCIGIRPVVALTSGVYIASGSGIEEDPYILAKE